MRLRPAIVDTNVVVAGVLGGRAGSPPARVLHRMVTGRGIFAASVALLAEYRAILLRRRIRARHGLSDQELDAVLTRIVAHVLVRDPAEKGPKAPEAGDQHLWDLMRALPAAVLVTGDAALVASAAWPGRVLTPREWLQVAKPTSSTGADSS